MDLEEGKGMLKLEWIGAIIEVVETPIVGLDFQGTIKLVNQAAEQQLGPLGVGEQLLQQIQLEVAGEAYDPFEFAGVEFVEGVQVKREGGRAYEVTLRLAMLAELMLLSFTEEGSKTVARAQLEKDQAAHRELEAMVLEQGRQLLARGDEISALRHELFTLRQRKLT